MKTKSSLNKTIDISVESGREYLEKCIRIESKAEINDILDKTIIGDTFHTIKLLPECFVDLLIADPPYNLDKSFNGKKFKKTNRLQIRLYSGFVACFYSKSYLNY